MSFYKFLGLRVWGLVKALGWCMVAAFIAVAIVLLAEHYPWVLIGLGFLVVASIWTLIQFFKWEDFGEGDGE